MWLNLFFRGSENILKTLVLVQLAATNGKLNERTDGPSLLHAALTSHRGVSCLAYSSAGRGGLLLSSGPDGQAVSLDTHSGKRLQQFRASKHGASAAALSQGKSQQLAGQLSGGQLLCLFAGRAACMLHTSTWRLAAVSLHLVC